MDLGKGLKLFTVMKAKTRAMKTGDLDKFQKLEVSKTKQSIIKGGEDFIGHEAIIDV